MLTSVMENVRSLFKGDRTPDAAQQFANIQQLLTQEIVEHFASEEKNLFPWMLTDNSSADVAQTIVTLCQEHEVLREEAKRLSALLHDRSIAKCTGELWIALMDFFCDLHAHATKEDALFKLFT